jgi:hypothetical protein
VTLTVTGSLDADEVARRLERVTPAAWTAQTGLAP